MSDEPRRWYSGREIVLELFPATPERLVPWPARYALARDADDAGVVVRERASGRPLLHLAPVGRYNRRTLQLCCDLCDWSGNSRDLRFLRAEVPGAEGRRWRYLTACVDVEACDARRLDDGTLERLLGPAGRRADGERGRSDGERGRSDAERGRSDGERGRSDAERGRSDGERGR